MALDTHTFKTFPEFSKLTLEDRDAYEALIKDYPPIADMSFASLMTWWDVLDSCAVSQINGNLIISYWLPGDERSSGLSFAGIHDVDTSLCAIFDFQKERGDMPRIVHVPEFVISNMKYPQLFTFEAEPDQDECIYAISDIYPLSRAKKPMRSNIEKFISTVGEDRIMVRSLDLRLPENQDLILSHSDTWYQKGTHNYICEDDREFIKTPVALADELGVENVCLFVGGELAGFQFYQVPHDKRYAIATFVRTDPKLPGSGDYMFYVAAKTFAEFGASYINYEQDLGLSHLRAIKLHMGPTNFFRKYTITPVNMVQDMEF